MLRLSEVKLPIDHPEGAIEAAILKRLGIPPEALTGFSIFKRSVDARKAPAILFTYILDVNVDDEAAVLDRLKSDRHVALTPDTSYRFVAHAPAATSTRPVIIGMGPAGLLAGLILAQSGFRPLILERGKIVRERTRDTFGFWRRGDFNPESNVQFGEGGAGTFSDGKLYSQIKDPRHYGRKVLEEFVKAGAPAEILYANRPHIGTFRLVSMVEKMRATIQSLGGEIRFQSRVADIEIVDGRVRGVVLAGGEHIATDHLVLAIGHSARDTFQMLLDRGVHVEPKPFSIGFRIEHPQSLIDRARFGKNAGNPLLGAADYRLVHHASNGRSVYSFCMCPGGTVVAATSEPGLVVTNGMSQYSHDERNANAGIVVGITPEDFPGAVTENPLAGVDLQRALESRAFELGGGTYEAPGQLVGDFLAGTLVRELRFGACPPTRPASTSATSARPCPITPSRPSARRCRSSRSRSKASICPMRCSQAWRRAPHPRYASAATTTTCRASTPAACIPPARARAMRAASSPRRWTASRSPKPWR